MKLTYPATFYPKEVKNLKLTYPAIFYPWEGGNGFTVEVPDLPGCISEGNTLADAILMGVDAASGWVLSELEDGNTAPAASKLEDIVPEGDGFVSLIALDMDEYAEKYGKKAIRKNLTIPAWLNTFGEKHNLNFSQVLQEALTSIVNDYFESLGDQEINDKTAAKILKAAGIESDDDIE